MPLLRDKIPLAEMLKILPIALLSLSIRMVAAGQTASPPTALSERALLDKYCVTCHNDKTKIANFSLQKEDLSADGYHPETWEKVIRKLRAGMMPPPGMPRPPLAKYKELRDWLEAQVDRG